MPQRGRRAVGPDGHERQGMTAQTPLDVVLVIEDEPHIRRAVRNALSDVAGEVLEAETGARGIDIAAASRPALIVLDLGLPDLPGLDVLREIRAWSQAPIVVLSARHSDREK